MDIPEEAASARMYNENAPDFVRACAVEHMDLAQWHFYVRIYSKNAAAQRAYPDLTRPSLLP